MQPALGDARAYDGLIACGRAAIWRIDPGQHSGRETLPHNDNTRITRTSHMFTKHKISRCPRHPVSGGREARRGPRGRCIHNCVIAGWSSAAMAWPAGAEPMTSSVDSRRRRQPRSSRWPRQSNGMMGSPTFLSHPRDRMGHPVALENVADVRRAAALAAARGRRTDVPQSQISQESKA